MLAQLYQNNQLTAAYDFSRFFLNHLKARNFERNVSVISSEPLRKAGNVEDNGDNIVFLT